MTSFMRTGSAMELMIESGRIVCLVDAQEQVIRCRDGALWITEDCSPDASR